MARTQSRHAQTEAIKIMFWNCSNGISRKLSVVKSLIKQFEPHLFFVTEAEIKENSNKDYKFYTIRDYDFHLSQTISLGKSRTICYSLKSLNCKRRKDLENPEQEIIVIDVLKLRVVGVYMPFTQQTDQTRNESFQALLLNLRSLTANNNDRDLICGGDYNVDWQKESKMKAMLQEWNDDYSLTQIVNKITRYRCITLATGEKKDERSILDHIYVRSKKNE